LKPTQPLHSNETAKAMSRVLFRCWPFSRPWTIQTSMRRVMGETHPQPITHRRRMRRCIPSAAAALNQYQRRAMHHGTRRTSIQQARILQARTPSSVPLRNHRAVQAWKSSSPFNVSLTISASQSTQQLMGPVGRNCPIFMEPSVWRAFHNRTVYVCRSPWQWQPSYIVYSLMQVQVLSISQKKNYETGFCSLKTITITVHVTSHNTVLYPYDPERKKVVHY